MTSLKCLKRQLESPVRLWGGAHLSKRVCVHKVGSPPLLDNGEPKPSTVSVNPPKATVFTDALPSSSTDGESKIRATSTLPTTTTTAVKTAASPPKASTSITSPSYGAGNLCRKRNRSESDRGTFDELMTGFDKLRRIGHSDSVLLVKMGKPSSPPRQEFQLFPAEVQESPSTILGPRMTSMTLKQKTAQPTSQPTPQQRSLRPPANYRSLDSGDDYLTWYTPECPEMSTLSDTQLRGMIAWPKKVRRLRRRKRACTSATASSSGSAAGDGQKTATRAPEDNLLNNSKGSGSAAKKQAAGQHKTTESKTSGPPETSGHPEGKLARSSSSTTSATTDDNPGMRVFTEAEVLSMVRDLTNEREGMLRRRFDDMLYTKLRAQYEEFTKFSDNYLRRTRSNDVSYFL